MPYKYFAFQGTLQMIQNCPDKISPLTASLVPHIKAALKTRELETVQNTLKVLKTLLDCNTDIGPLLVPFYDQILPSLNLLKVKGDGLDTKIQETLELLETKGGESAYE